jgi:DNA polymerase-3 subunit epsilon
MIKSFDPAECICLDAEFAQGDGRIEMLELSVVDFDGRTIYDQRFKPAKIDAWDTHIHHIEPADVADCPLFADERPKIQALVDAARYVCGFAVEENDIYQLKRHGITGFDAKQVLEVRDWFWVAVGERMGLDREDRINLAKVCAELGVTVDEEQAHGALYDTQITLECFRLTLQRLVEEEFADREPTMTEVVARFTERLDTLLAQYAKERSQCWCAIFKRGEGRYMFRTMSQEPDKENPALVASIFVESRDAAVLYFSKMLTGRIKGRTFFFDKLTNKQLIKFTTYTNTFDADAYAFQAKLVKLSTKFRVR